MGAKKRLDFFITIRDTQNHTWQGTIEWINTQKKQEFRSALEMMKLIDSTIEKDEDLYTDEGI